MIERGRSLDRERGRKRERSRARSAKTESLPDEAMEDAGLSNTQLKKHKRESSQAAKREASVTRGHSRPRDPSAVGLHTEEAVKAAMKKERLGRMGWHGAAGEGDNRKAVHLVKWMNTGKKVRFFVAFCLAINVDLQLPLTFFLSLQRMGTHNKR